ncbi:MAG: CDP-glycerol glycerophosphotransferase family protein [Oscillospiraceae bacterium]|nr:CDP-glycerol glycerophosphotransferase family protein [Oscillospiraceae bacterium]
MKEKAWIASLLKKTKRIFTRKVVSPAVYGFSSLKPLDEHKVVFVEGCTKELSSNFAAIYAKLAENGSYRLRVFCLNKKAMGNRYRGEVLRFLRDAATAKYVFFDDSQDIQGSMGKRKGQVFVQVWHGAGAFKKFGRSTMDKIFGDSRKDADRFPISAQYDLVTVSSEEVKWAYAEALGEKNSAAVQATGLSRTDCFFDPAYLEKAKRRVFEEVPEASGKKIILYAPTFRGRVAEATAPDRMDIPAFAGAFRSEYVLLIKQHPHVRKRPPIPDGCQGFAFDVTDRLSIEELLCVSDLCISDYSSLIFEYSLFERPMIFFAYDLSDYEDWRGFYYPYEELTPGPVFRTNEEVIRYIRNVDREFDKKTVRAFREKFMSACDGHATDRILKLVFQTRRE